MTDLLKRAWVVSSFVLALGALVLSPSAFASGDCPITCETCVIDLNKGKAVCSDCTISSCGPEEE